MKKVLLLLPIFLLIFSAHLNGQDFLEGYSVFSTQKPAYVTLNDGTEIEGKIKGAKWKKGLMHTIKFISDGSTDKEQISVEEIAFMYVAPQGFEKLVNSINNATTVNRWDRDLKADYLKDGYLYFEQVEAMVGNKKRTVLMQLINPHFSGNIRVYNDPFANETGGLGIAGMQVTGGYDKSFYVKKGEETANKLLKKQFKKLYDDYFGDCPEFTKTVDRPNWKEFAAYVAGYNSTCETK